VRDDVRECGGDGRVSSVGEQTVLRTTVNGGKAGLPFSERLEIPLTDHY
jgi:hypothetical protein